MGVRWTAALLLLAPIAAADAPHVGVPYEEKCAAVPTGDASKLATSDKMVVSIDGFLRPDVGVPEAVALLGPPTVCNHEPKSSFAELYLTTSGGVHAAHIEVHDGAMIGLGVELDPPVAIDMTALVRRFGKPKLAPAPEDSFEPGGDDFQIRTADFSAQLMFFHRDGKDPESSWKVHQILLRRTPMIEILPDRFDREADVARLVALALRDPAPEPVAFYGTLGVYAKTAGNHITLDDATKQRNITNASIDTQGDRLHALAVSFPTPIATTASKLAKAIGATVDANGVLVAPHGKVRAAFSHGALIGLVVERS